MITSNSEKNNPSNNYYRPILGYTSISRYLWASLTIKVDPRAVEVNYPPLLLKNRRK